MNILMNDENSALKARNNWLSVFVLILMLTNVGILALTSGNLGWVTTLDSNESDLNNIENRLNISEHEIEGLKEELKMVELQGNATYFDFISIYYKTGDSVVFITTDLGSGSGWVYGKEGYIITNNHVIDGASFIEISFLNGVIVPATLVGRDPYSDLAVLKVEVQESILFPLPLGDSSELLVGEIAIAIGNPFGLANTMTTGIISATGRQMNAPEGYAIVDVIQTDAAINPGNSGGPLLNLKGEVIGMNTAIISNSQDSSGIGFAIPSDTIAREVNSIIETSQFIHPWLGLSGVDMTPAIAEAMGLESTTRGTLVVRVIEGSPADIAGLQVGDELFELSGAQLPIGGDIIYGVEGKTMDKFYELQVYLARNVSPGDELNFMIIRGKKGIVLPFIIGNRPLPNNFN